nr:PREDICTED: vascular cell adhesion protein 1-like isoform X1 [Lepisosteus oculatus]
MGVLWTACVFGLILASTLEAVPECPLEISPQKPVVRYGDPVTVNCTATQTPRGMGWEATVGATGMKTGAQSVTWSVSSLTDWTAEPKCYGNFLTEPKQCRKNLIIILYKYPASVSLSSDSPVDQMVEGRQYQLQCEVQNIAPVQYLTVNWYRGQTLIHSQTFSHNTTRTPVNVSVRHLFTADRAHSGKQLTCEAELNLGPEGPQPPPANQSDPLQITVLYEPEITGCPLSVDLEEHHSLQSSVTCTAEGSPPPKTRWVKDGQQIDPSVKMTRTDEGQFTYEATNTQGTVNHTVMVEVRYKPVFSQSGDTIQTVPGNITVLVCRADGNPPPRYNWTYSTADNVAVKYTDRGSTVTINGASTSNTGIYTCFATNEVGEAQKTFKVKLKNHAPDVSALVGWIVVGLAVSPMFVG